jgi:8-oxo-dGTP diphosphatase
LVILKNNLVNIKKQATHHSHSQVPAVGVGVFLVNIKEEKLLLGKRRESGLFGLPGGWLEIGEDWDEAASRELWEETSLVKQSYSFRHIHTLNCRQLENNIHSISCVMYNEVEPHELAKVRNKEPHKCYGWIWVSINQLRKNIDKLFFPLRIFLNKFPKIKKVSDLKEMIKVFMVKKTL